MVHSLASPPGRRLPFHAFSVVLLVLLSVSILTYRYLDSGPLVDAMAKTSTGPSFPHQRNTSDLSVDWSNGGDFDPRDKCPDDFFSAGFKVICKRLADGNVF